MEDTVVDMEDTVVDKEDTEVDMVDMVEFINLTKLIKVTLQIF